MTAFKGLVTTQVTQALSSYLMFIYIHVAYGSERPLEIKLTKQYCFTYLYSVFSCCSMWNPEPFRVLLSFYFPHLPVPILTHSITLKTTQDSTWSNKKRHCKVSKTILFCKFYFYRIFMDRANFDTKSYIETVQTTMMLLK